MMDFSRNSEIYPARLKQINKTNRLLNVGAQESRTEEPTIGHQPPECSPQQGLNVVTNLVQPKQEPGDLIKDDLLIKQDPDEIEIKEEPLDYSLHNYTSNLNETKQQECLTDLNQENAPAKQGFEESTIKNELLDDELHNHTSNSHVTETGEKNSKKIVLKKEKVNEIEPIGMNQGAISSTNTLPRQFICKKCRKYTSSLAELILHSKLHIRQRLKMFTCKICKVVFENKADLDAHVRAYKTHKCKQCDFRGGTKYSLVDHTKIHTGEKPFKCGQCDFRTSRKGGLKTHMLRHAVREQFECEACYFSSCSKHSLRAHVKAHIQDRLLKCELCDFHTARRGVLVKHRTTHPDDGASSKTDFIPNLKTYGSLELQCTDCEFKCKQKSTLTLHKIIHTGKN